MFQSSSLAHGPPVGPTNLAPSPSSQKKRTKKSKDKQQAKSSKTSHGNAAQTKIPDVMTRPAMLPTNDMMPQNNSHFNIAQLSPSVEEIVSELDQELRQQNPEEDIMDIQLQSFSSGANVPPETSQGLINPSPFDQQALQGISKQQSQHGAPEHCNIMHPGLQKQQSVPCNFAPEHIPVQQKMFHGQNMGFGSNTVHQDPSFFNQLINVQGRTICLMFICGRMSSFVERLYITDGLATKVVVSFLKTCRRRPLPLLIIQATVLVLTPS